MQNEFITFFQELLGISAQEWPCLNALIAKDGPCLNRKQQKAFIQPVTRMNIVQALRGLPNDKSPGVDGFNVEFLKE